MTKAEQFKQWSKQIQSDTDKELNPEPSKAMKFSRAISGMADLAKRVKILEQKMKHWRG